MRFADLFYFAGMTLGIVAAGLCFGRAAYLYFKPPESDGCWVRRHDRKADEKDYWKWRNKK